MRKTRSAGEGKRSILLGVLIGAAVCLLLLSGAARLTEKGVLPESMMQTAALLACGLGSLVGGLVAVHRQKQRLTPALVCGGTLAALLLLFGLLFSGKEGLGAGLVYSLLAALLPAALMGLRRGRTKRR